MSLLKLAETVGIYKGAVDFVTKISLLIIAFYAPLKGLILTILLLVVLDLVTGLWASIKKRTKITSAKLSRTITKLMVYLFTISVVQIVAKFIILIGDVPITEMVSSFIILTELQSVLENVNKISKQNFLVALIDKISLVTKGRNTRKEK